MTDEELLTAAQEVHDGWYASDARIDWPDFIDRLELHADVDLGNSMTSPLIEKVKKHIRAYRKL